VFLPVGLPYEDWCNASEVCPVLLLIGCDSHYPGLFPVSEIKITCYGWLEVYFMMLFQ
jgi:hypothetical protein